MKIEVLNAVIATLRGADPTLLTDEKLIYAVPAITWLKAGSPTEIQVCDGGSSYPPLDPRYEVFDVMVGILQRQPTDYGRKHEIALTTVATSILKLKEQIVSVLDISLLGGVLVSPLLISAEGPVMNNHQYPDLLVKTVTFRGAYIVGR